jgi:hypothetical protein
MFSIPRVKFDVISEPNKKYDWITFVIFFVDDTIYLIKTQGHHLIYLIFRKLDMRLLKHVIYEIIKMKVDMRILNLLVNRDFLKTVELICISM